MKSRPAVLLVDIGNSRIKSSEVVDNLITTVAEWGSLAELLAHYAPSIPLVISSVKSPPLDLLRGRNFHLVSHTSRLPLTLEYETPETLGADRIAAAVGAAYVFPKTNLLVADIGTCMTIDLITADGIFRGGIISPGIRLRLKAMATYTDRLPDISSNYTMMSSEIVGKTTQDCMWSGAVWGIIHELKGIHKTLSEDFTSLNMIISGGDARYFESYSKAHIFAGSKLIHEGLFHIWKMNEG